MNFLKLVATNYQPVEVRISRDRSTGVDQFAVMMSRKDGKVSEVIQHQDLSSDQDIQMYCNNSECSKLEVDN